MPMWKVEQCMEMFFCSTGIYLLLHYNMLSTVIVGTVRTAAHIRKEGQSGAAHIRKEGQPGAAHTSKEG